MTSTEVRNDVHNLWCLEYVLREKNNRYNVGIYVGILLTITKNIFPNSYLAASNKSSNSKELFLHTEANAHLKEEIEENVKGIRLRSTELTRRTTVQRKGWNKSEYYWKRFADLLWFVRDFLGFISCCTDLRSFTWISIKHLSTSQFSNHQPSLQNPLTSISNPKTSNIIYIHLNTSSTRTSRGRKFPKGKELYNTERICL